MLLLIFWARKAWKYSNTFYSKYLFAPGFKSWGFALPPFKTANFIKSQTHVSAIFFCVGAEEKVLKSESAKKKKRKLSKNQVSVVYIKMLISIRKKGKIIVKL